MCRISRKQRDREIEADRVLLRNIINTWKDIKALRQAGVNQSNCVNTPVKLLIRKCVCYYTPCCFNAMLPLFRDDKEKKDDSFI